MLVTMIQPFLTMKVLLGVLKIFAVNKVFQNTHMKSVNNTLMMLSVRKQENLVKTGIIHKEDL